KYQALSFSRYTIDLFWAIYQQSEFTNKSNNIHKLLTTCHYQNNQLPKEFSEIVSESDISTIAIIVESTDSVKDNNIHNSEKETINNKATTSNKNNVVPISNQYNKFFTNILLDLDHLENISGQRTSNC
ncbi:15580_t:CDS:2, partial [Dentiscutata heterogama]